MFNNNKIMEVVNLVWNNRERLLALVERLPETLRETGESIESAGKSAMNAGLFFGSGQKDAGTSAVDGNASELSAKAAVALQKCYKELQDTARLMRTVSNELDDIWFPRLEPQYRELMGVNLITGLDMEKTYPLSDTARRLKEGAGTMSTISQELREVAASLKQLSGVLVDAGDDLHHLGQRLIQSGQTLRDIGQIDSLGEVIDRLDGEDETDEGGFSISEM